MRILIIDEEPNIRRVLACTVEPEHSAMAVATWQEAWLCLRRQYFDAVVVDLHLSSADGLEVLERLAAGTHCAGVIAYSTSDQREVALRKGAVDCLTQPFTPEEFRKALTKIPPRPPRPPVSSIGLDSLAAP